MRNHVRADGKLSHILDKSVAQVVLGSSFHVVEYNSTTGEVIKRRTAQGYSDGRCVISRFPASNILLTTLVPGLEDRLGGSTGSQIVSSVRVSCLSSDLTKSAVHKNTKIPGYIDTARRMATYYLDNIPSTGLVPW